MLIQNQILVFRGFESVNMIETLKWLQKCTYHDTHYFRACTVRIFFKILYVLLTIKPRHGHDLHENGEHDGSSGGEGVQYLKHVHPSLHTEITCNWSIIHTSPLHILWNKKVYATGTYYWTWCWQNEYMISDGFWFDFNIFMYTCRLKLLQCFLRQTCVKRSLKVFKNL